MRQDSSWIVTIVQPLGHWHWCTALCAARGDTASGSGDRSPGRDGRIRPDNASNASAQTAAFRSSAATKSRILAQTNEDGIYDQYLIKDMSTLWDMQVTAVLRRTTAVALALGGRKAYCAVNRRTVLPPFRAGRSSVAVPITAMTGRTGRRISFPS